MDQDGALKYHRPSPQKPVIPRLSCFSPKIPDKTWNISRFPSFCFCGFHPLRFLFFADFTFALRGSRTGKSIQQAEAISARH
jgi:hypothetical protein